MGQPNLTFSPQLIGTSSTALSDLVIANGGAALDEVFATVGGPNANDFAMTNLCQSYGVNSSCYINVAFAPGGIGIRTASLTVSSANATVTPQVFSLSGAGVINPTVSVTPSATTITTNQAISLSVSVTGTAGTPSGSLTLNGSGAPIPLSNGVATIYVPAGSLAAGTDQLYADYRPDSASSSIYASSYGETTVTVLTADSYSVPTEPMGTTAPTQTATVSLPASFTLGAINVVTQGAANLDYSLASGGTCAVGTAYTSGQTCTVNFTFSPTAPGTRLGAIDIYDNSMPTPILEATLFLNGEGTGPMVNFLPAVQSFVGSGSYDPFGVAVDGAGNIYISDTLNSRVLKETASDGTYTESTIGSGLSLPDQIAVDGNGNIYIADTGNSRVLMETLSGGTYIQSELDSGLSSPDGVAVDGNGNVYIADTGNNRVLVETLANGSYTQNTVASNGLNVPTGVAVDGKGNVYIADDFNDRVLLETLSGTSYSESVVASGLDHPYGVAVDAMGNAYIADSYNNRILKEAPVANAYLQSVVGTGLNTPLGEALDQWATSILPTPATAGC